MATTSLPNELIPVTLPPGRDEVRHQADLDRVVDDGGDHRDGRRRALGGEGRPRAHRDDDVGLEAHQLGGKAGQAVGLALGPAEMNLEVLSFDVTELAQRLPERVERGRAASRASGAMPPRKPMRSLRGCAEHRQRTAEQARGDGDSAVDVASPSQTPATFSSVDVVIA